MVLNYILVGCPWFGSLLASDNKQLVFRKNVFQCLYTLCGSVHELSDFQKLVPCLQRKPFRLLSTSFKRVGQSYLKTLWQNTSRVKKIYILILLQFTKYWGNKHLGKLILGSEKTNSTVGFSGPCPSSENSHFQNKAKWKTFLVKLSFTSTWIKNLFSYQ